MPLLELGQQLALPWQRRVGRPFRRARLLALGASVVGCAHLARLGSQNARLAGLLLFASVVAVFAVRTWNERRRWQNPRRILGKVLGGSPGQLGPRTLRALTLIEQGQAGTLVGSRELAQIHFERLLAQATPSVVVAGAERQARRWRWFSGVLLAGVLIGVVVDPRSVVEGLDVLAAWRGRAPLPLVWLEHPRIQVESPAYLRERGRMLLPGLPARQAVGSVVTIKGLPVAPGRLLVLTDGRTEVPFVSDGTGAVAASWTLGETAGLRVAARFGEVLIEEPLELPLEAVADEPPQVHLDGAPRTVRMAESGQVVLLYTARDDHGLRQVDLVLSSGGREERRVLLRLDAETRLEAGGHVLSSADAFLQRMFLPVEVTIEARDSDPVTGPKWGRSKAVTILPPEVGQAEAERWRALVAARLAVVDLVASRGERADGPEDGVHARVAALRVRKAADAVHQGLPASQGLRAFLHGQARVLERVTPPGASPLRRAEDVSLALDAAIEALGVRDAQKVSRRLAEVADEVANGARQGRGTEGRTASWARVDAALDALGAGVVHLGRLGVLGRDLAGVAAGDLRRIERARAQEDLLHVELASQHLAARLRRPAPSFPGARSRGLEAGGGMAGDPGGAASQADQLFNELAQELEQLAGEHADSIQANEEALQEIEQSLIPEGLQHRAQERAEKLRRAAESLPLPGADPGSPRAAAALAREHVEAMAQSLERLALSDALRSGKDGRGAVESAEQTARGPLGPLDDVEQEALNRARQELGEQVAWVEAELAKLKRLGSDRERAVLERSAEQERGFARRAGNLAGRGQNSEASLPEEVLENLQRADSVMQEAARELGRGNGERALELQREAQRLLERADTGRTDGAKDDAEKQDDAGQREGSGRQGMRTDGDLPPERKRLAEDFRKRVVEVLGRSRGGRLGPAVKRYAEGLLQ